jgi:hypothetical protein
VYLDLEKRLNPRIKRSELLSHQILGGLSILRMPRATNFSVTAHQARELESMVRSR